MKTRSISHKEINRNWYEVDASNVRLGNLATKIAELLMGKDKPANPDYLDGGDYVIVTNMKQVSIHPRKWKQKKYYRHSGYIGSLKEETLEELFERKPEQVLINAVKGMLPKTRQQSEMLKRLYIYLDENHEHEAQKPEKVTIK